MHYLIESALVFALALIILNLTQWLIRRHCRKVETERRAKQQEYIKHRDEVESKSRKAL